MHRHLHRRAHGLILSFLLCCIPGWAAAVTSTPLTTVPGTHAIAPLGEPDLLEHAFREGVALYESGDYTAAARAWHGPAQRGHTGAQFSLGVAYATGNGVSTSLERAIHWWRSAAAQDHVGAQLNLGLLYWRGEGVEKDLTQARLWWERAANGGDAAAQFHLGALAATGEGAARNYKEAVRWWRLSAAQGYRQAIKGLEILKSHGATTESGD